MEKGPIISSVQLIPAQWPTRAVLTLYFASLFYSLDVVPSVPWLHEHAQWSDVVFAAAVLAWLLDGGSSHLAAAEASHWRLRLPLLALLPPVRRADPRAGVAKLLGIVELCALAFITSDLASRPRVSRGIVRAIAITSLVTAVVALAGLLLFYAGVSSRLIGIYGELEPSSLYARVQAGTHNPNLLASFCIFASAIVAQRDGALPRWLRRVALAALWLTVLLTFSRGILGFGLAAAVRGARPPAAAE